MSDTPPGAYEALVHFLYQAPIGLVQTTLDGSITMINPMSAQLLMPLVADGNLDNLFDVLRPVAPQLRTLAAQPVAAGGLVCDGLRVPLPAGAARGGQPAGPPLILAVRMVKLDDSTLMVCLADVTLAALQEQHRLTSSLLAASRTDPLTRLPTRSVVLERIAAARRRAHDEPASSFAVLSINADRFSRINVTQGHAAGDALLRLMAGRLHGAVRQHDVVGHATMPQQTTARLGGNDFVVVLEGLRSADDVRAIAQRLVDALARPYLLDGADGADDSAPLHLSASIGVVLGGTGGASHTLFDPDPACAAVDAESVLQDASLAMREAKRAGGGRWCLFTPALKERAWRRGSLETELRLALDAGQLFVVYQPIVDLHPHSASTQPAITGIAGMEALVRWRHPQRGIVPPGDFIEIAEETGLIGALGAFVLQQACRQLVAWQQDLGPLAPRLMSVNLSRAQLGDPDIVALVSHALHSSGLAPACLQLEVTESMAAQDGPIQVQLHALKALGLSLALDDFGTGYSSLSSLHQLPIDVVKIDRSFVCQAETSAHHRVLIEATVSVARSLQMRTVAEGIETAGQAAVLTALLCDKGQGYLFSRPLEAEAATAWLSAGGLSLAA